MTPTPNSLLRLRKHADYQRVYKAGRKQFAKQMSFFYTVRPQVGADGAPLRGADNSSPRVGLTVGKVMGKAVDRNRIKRRMREAVRKNLSLLRMPVDVVLHPRRSVIDLEWGALEREVAAVFRTIQRTIQKGLAGTAEPVQRNDGERTASQPPSANTLATTPRPQ
ncbi:MAG: ribonuclease P protein component [Acidobacteriota bacterium]|nr:ribonuclease P protein component [Acidobacteriota bacterium]